MLLSDLFWGGRVSIYKNFNCVPFSQNYTFMNTNPLIYSLYSMISCLEKIVILKSYFPRSYTIWTILGIWPSEVTNSTVCRLHTCSSCFWCCFLILLYPVNCSFSSLVCSCSLNCLVTIDVGRIVAKLLVSGSLRPLAWDICKWKEVKI